MIKRKDYNLLIERIKVFAQENPSSYKQRVLLLGILGYAYIFLVLSILVVLIAAIAWLMINVRHSGSFIKILIFLGILVYLILKSLWIKIDAPTGIMLTEKEAPKLFALIREICVKQSSVYPDKVLLNNDFNASISQVPFLGIFGWYKNYLVLGLPYMIASDLGQFKAVIAHEFGHFSGSHGRAGIWIYRIRASWYNIMMNLQNERTGNLLFKWFFEWYVPYFNAYSLVLVRVNEYEADRYANAYAGAQANAEELVNALIKSIATGPYWNTVWERANEAPIPPQDVFTRAVEQLQQPVSENRYRDELFRALKFRTQNHDTHPCLKERLAALGYSIDGYQIIDGQGTPLICQKTIVRNAAEELLDHQAIVGALRHFDEEWVKQVEIQWKERYEQVQKMKKELAQLNQKVLVSNLSEEECTNRAYIIDQIASRKEALTAIQELVQHYPNNAQAQYRLGELLLEEYDDRGIENLKKAMQYDPSFASSALEKLSWYHESKGDYGQVESTLDNLEQTADNDQKDYLERNTVRINDTFKEHGLSAETIADLCQQLTRFEKEISQVYLVQKKLAIYPQNPMYVLAVNGKMKGFQWDSLGASNKLLDELLKNVKPRFLVGSYIYIVSDQSLIKKIRKIPNAIIRKA